MINFPRIALFADTFHEVNGAANIIRHLEAFARQNDLPFLCVRAGKETRFDQDGTQRTLELRRSNASFPVDGELRYDPFLWRYRKIIKSRLDEFRPDVVHLTGLNDVSQLGFFFAHFRDIPAVASWHTNVHEYTASRLAKRLSWLPGSIRKGITNGVEKVVMRGIMRLHFLAQVQLAPNQELVQEIQRMTRRPSFLLSRGVDTAFFNHEKRSRINSPFTLGYVGRLRPEKNVRLFAKIEQALQEAGITDYRFVLIGEGCERSWLKDNLAKAELPGVLVGERLARAFADMDLFVFPSQTDAFGNVVLEAMASGVPALVMPEGGPKYLIKHDSNGFVAKSEADFLNTVVELARSPERVSRMKPAARAAACERSWDRVFEGLYDKYYLSTKVSKKVRV